jgi:hypothetical protein
LHDERFVVRPDPALYFSPFFFGQLELLEIHAGVHRRYLCAVAVEHEAVVASGKELPNPSFLRLAIISDAGTSGD